MAEVNIDNKCPRCAVNPQYPLGKNLGALSRTTRDEGAPITVCPDCGSREAMVVEYGEEYEVSLPSYTDWPLSVEELLAEDRIRYDFGQAARLEGDE